MASGKQGLFVVVWEWENKQRRWRPYPPEVTQQLERAFSKNLRSVFLGDSDPSLKNYCINLPQMEQECRATGERVKVHRMFYPQSSPAGLGAVWQWAGDATGDWHTYDMCVQCVIEESWGTGAQTLDMSDNFPMCPYVINFCNLTQMNKKTGFIRGIRRLQQAAYPVGKPTVPPHLPHYHHPPGNSNSSNSSYTFNSSSSVSKSAAASATATAGPSAGTSGEKPKRRGSRDEAGMATTTTDSPNKARIIINKVLGRGHSSSSSSRNSSMSPPAQTSASTSTSTGRSSGGGQWSGQQGTTSPPPPRPLPRSNVPPVPKPRTSVPPSRPYYPPLGDSQQHLLEDQERYRQASGLRNDASMGRFGSNVTLDSDCSSLVSGSRRPSVDTISTYLSQDGEDEAGPGSSGSSSTRTHSHQQDSGTSGNPIVDQLIRVESDESMDDDDDDVFGEDQEVCDVMRGVAGRSSPPRAPSPLPHHAHHTHHHHHHHSHHSHTPHLQQNHFVPISAAQSGSDMGQQLNGVKRKRTGERAGPAHRQPGGADASLHHNSCYHHHHNHNNHNHNHSNHNNNNHHHHYHHKHQQGSRAPIAPEDQLLVQYTSAVPTPSDEMCSICMWSLREPSGFSDDVNTPGAARVPQIPGVPSDGVVSLVLCGHQFHLACVRQMAKSSSQYLECPNCKTLHGEKHGNQPQGHMSIKMIHGSLPGHPECNTIEISYSIKSGVQGPEHPQPGRPYHAVGFPRIAYVPNNEKGKKVVQLLQEAWRRRLIFTIGTSVTMGIENCVTWNEIHHKTEWNNYSGHGYPDPHYLDNALKELELHGVTEATLV